MQKKTGVHFYINIANFDDVADKVVRFHRKRIFKVQIISEKAFS